MKTPVLGLGLGVDFVFLLSQQQQQPLPISTWSAVIQVCNSAHILDLQNYKIAVWDNLQERKTLYTLHVRYFDDRVDYSI